MKEPKTTYEFSKKFAIATLMLTVVITVCALGLMYMTGDLSTLPVLVTAIFAELATSTGFYYNKAKSENKIKLKNEIILNTLKLQSEYIDADLKNAKELMDRAESMIEDEDLDTFIDDDA